MIGAQAGIIDRRGLMRLGAQAAAMLALLTAVEGCTGHADIDIAASGDMVTSLGDIVIPVTRTGGASAADNVAFVLRAVDSGLMKVPRDLLQRLQEQLDGLADGDFVRARRDVQQRAVERIDAATFAAQQPPTHPWFAVKALILMSYYTSEVGMTEELRYELAPGRYDRDVIVDADWRALSNDWAAVSVKKPLRP